MTVRVRVIPCLDVADGRVVKGVNFVDLIDAGDPVEQARAYDAAGADELCFLDIGASHEGRDTLVDVRVTLSVGLGTLQYSINEVTSQPQAKHKLETPEQPHHSTIHPPIASQQP